jgi:two-component system response regulator YesN
MLKMIIADDEPIVREGLRTCIPWADYDIGVVAEASNGQQVLDLCEIHKPDILFTDIRMPILDGLEVSAILLERKLDIRIIIISGIKDFNYAKAALDINAEGYILKPVKIDELTLVVKKVVASIKMERNKESKFLELRELMAENISIAREKFLYNLVTGFFNNEAEIRKKLEYFGLSEELASRVVVCVLEIDDYDKNTCNYMEGDKQLLSYAVANVIDEFLSINGSGISLCKQENEFIILFFESALENEEHLKICENIASSLDKFLDLPVSIGIGHECAHVMQVSASYLSALRAKRYKFYTGNKSILNIEDIELFNQLDAEKTGAEYPDFYEVANRLIGCVKIGNSAGAEKIIVELFDKFIKNRKYSIEYIQSISSELFYAASRATFELGTAIEQIIGNRAKTLETILSIDSIYGLRDYLMQMFMKISSYFSKKYTQKNEKIIQKIKEIVRTRYMEDISISKISEEIYFSPNYISLIFKQETGETINEHITQRRMEAAKELLGTTDFKIFEIAEMVGYEDAHYFSTVFKKHYGILPAKFRKI